MKSVLWVEDQAIHELRELRTAVIMSGQYYLAVVKDGTEAIKALMQQSKIFDIIVVDMRIPPGDDKVFSEIYAKHLDEPRAAEIGFHLLKRIFDKGDNNHLADLPKYAYDHFRYGVLSIDGKNEIGKALLDLGISNYTHKTGFMPIKTLLQLIVKIDNSLPK